MDSAYTIADALRTTFPVGFSAAVVLGSGLGGFADMMDIRRKVITTDIPGFPPSTVSGHAGALLDAYCEGKRILVFQGRIHGYEGYSVVESALPATIAAALGVPVFITTNAAGGLNPLLETGDLMLITDYLVLPIARQFGLRLQELGPMETVAIGTARPPRPTVFLTEAAASLARAAAVESGIALREGVYGFCSGPTYETRAEIHFLRRAGADAVGMSTVPELIVARRHSLTVIAISCITNKARTVPTRVSHDDVTAVAERAAARMRNLVRAIIRKV